MNYKECAFTSKKATHPFQIHNARDTAISAAGFARTCPMLDAEDYLAAGTLRGTRDPDLQLTIRQVTRRYW